VPVNLAGVPALSVPVGWGEDDDSRLPIGLQLIGAHWSEDRLFDLGKQLEWKKG
jgi:aspartyl-tRNA(Asn)/glutamyl-tRNA(Gln) amidotransferase subunit A